jgi:archaellum biogenesis ATPase FlaH
MNLLEKTENALKIVQTSTPIRPFPEGWDLIPDEDAFPSPGTLVPAFPAFDRGALTLFSGASKSRKSWIAMELAIGAASGTSFQGFPCEKSTKILYADLELLPRTLLHRLHKTARNLGVNRSTLNGRLKVLPWRHQHIGRPPGAVIREMIRVCKSWGAEYVIIDSLYVLMNGDESKPEVVLDALNQVAELSRESGVGVLMLHHFTKGSSETKDQIDRGSGSGVLARMPDALLTISKVNPGHGIEDAFVFEATLRDHPPVKPFATAWRNGILTPLNSSELPEDPRDLLKPPKTEKRDHTPGPKRTAKLNATPADAG